MTERVKSSPEIEERRGGGLGEKKSHRKGSAKKDC